MIDKEKLGELEKVLDERLKNNINKFKRRAKKKFGLCEEPLIFHFDPTIGPVYFCSNEQNRPSYISEQKLSRFAGLTDFLGLGDGSNLDVDVISLKHWNGKKYEWEVFFDYFEVVNNEGPNRARGDKEMFSLGVVSLDSKPDMKMLGGVKSYFKKWFQKYYLHDERQTPSKRDVQKRFVNW